MNNNIQLKYPVYIISKGRYEKTLTADFLTKDNVDFRIAVEPQEYEKYAKVIDKSKILVLPFFNLGLGSYPARNFCWEHSIKNGFKYHWLFDDNIDGIYRANKGNRFLMDSKIALKASEDFVERYLNIGIAGFNYVMFASPQANNKPYRLNHHVYSGMLIRNNVPFRWRLRYNEDTDLNLQFLNNKYCLIQFNCFLINKMTTMTMKGGNMTELYKGEGRLVMARALQKIWPQYVEVKFKFKRPQHSVNWKKHFKHQLIKNPLYDFSKLEKINNYGMKLNILNDNIKKELLEQIEEINGY